MKQYLIIFNMAALSLSIDALRPLNRWDNNFIKPGAVGSVGGVNLTPRLKGSGPGAIRWDQTYYGNKACRYGSNVSDGMRRSFVSGGGPAKLVDSNWGGRRSFKIRHGWIMQDRVGNDTMVQPQLGETPQYSWRNKIGALYRARTTGDLFPIPAGGILEPAKNNLFRGGQFPRVTDVIGGDVIPESALESNVNAGPPTINPNYHPQFSSFTATGNPSDRNIILNKGATPGRMKR